MIKTRNLFLKHTYLSLLLLVLISVSGLVTAGSLVGHVTEDGNYLRDVEIKLISESDGVILQTTYSDLHGFFRFQVKPGVYSLAAYKDEYSPTRHRKLIITATDIKLSIEMVPEAFAENAVSQSDDCD
jgi:hypothetical protein